MDKEHFFTLLVEQQERGKELLSLISNMHESQNDFGDGMVIVGGEDLFYVPDDELDEFTNKFESWKSYVHELLEAQFGNDDQFVYDWDSNIGIYISKREPILPQLKKKVNKGVSLLDSFVQRLDFHFHDDEYVEKALKQGNIVKSPKVFISHASLDMDIIREFIDQILKNGLGLSDENIACTSFEWTTVSLGDNIPSYIYKNIEMSSVVLSMVSQAYKMSEPCQNEVGAAWALKRKPISIILPDADFSELGWLVNLDKAGRIDNADFLNHLQVDLCNLLGIQPKTALHWTPCVTKFIESIKKQVPVSKTNVKTEAAEQKHDKDLFIDFDKKFSEEDINYTLYNIQHTTHFSDFDLTTWHKIIHWFGQTSNTFLTKDVQDAAHQLCESLKQLLTFIGEANYSPDRISWSIEEDRNVTPEKWREIHEARIYSWEPEPYDSSLYHKRENIVLNRIPEIVGSIENSYNVFRMSIKKNLFI